MMPETYLLRTVHLTKNVSFLLPFGQTNGLAIFISFIYNVNSQGKSLATKLGASASIDDDKNARIIVDDIVSQGKDMETFLLCMECQLHTCLAYCLSLSVKKSFILRAVSPNVLDLGIVITNYAAAPITIKDNAAVTHKHESEP
jgi:hypothetical protein